LSVGESPVTVRSPPQSLKARALRWLAQREYSRSELRRKLLVTARHGAKADAQDDSAAAAGFVESASPAALESHVDALLDWLAARKYLSDERFVESRVLVRQQRFGNLRIRRELAEHGLALDAADAERLRQTELQRAKAVWARRFGEPAADAAGRARQARFLAGRGFSAGVIRQLLNRRTAGEED
jgi:regulatory protein